MSSKGKATGKTTKTKAGKEKEELPPLQPPKVLVTGPQRQVFIIDDADQLNDISTLQCVSLPHPKYAKPCRYLSHGSDVWEVQRIYQPPSSWLDLKREEIQEDGSLYMCTRIDPLFLALPLLERGRKKTSDHDGYFLQLDQLLPTSSFPPSLLRHPSFTDSIATICQKRDGWDSAVWRLDDEKVVSWLRAKMQRMRQTFKTIPSLQHLYSDKERKMALEEEEKEEEERKRKEEEAKTANTDEQKQPTSETGDQSSDTATSSSPSPSSPSSFPSTIPTPSLKQCFHFLSEYLPPTFYALLVSSYGLSLDDLLEKKRRSQWNDGGSQRVTADIDTSRPAGAMANNSDSKRKSDKPAQSVTAKKLAIAAKGTKSLASFFAPKKKT